MVRLFRGSPFVLVIALGCPEPSEPGESGDSQTDIEGPASVVVRLDDVVVANGGVQRRGGEFGELDTLFFTLTHAGGAPIELQGTLLEEMNVQGIARYEKANPPFSLGLDADEVDVNVSYDIDAADWRIVVTFDLVGAPFRFTVEDDPQLHDADGDGFDAYDDCDDTNPDVHPQAPERCNEIDDNCNRQIDEGLPLNLFFFDLDGDGFGDPEGTIESCRKPPDTSTMAGDCDDDDPGIHPAAAEVCNERDDDCDDEIDEGVAIAFFVDADDDGFGDPERSVLACSLPEGASIFGTDCNDADPEIHPGVFDQVGDEIDADCDGLNCQEGQLGEVEFGLCFGQFVWPEARTMCQTSYRDIAAITSAAEQSFVVELMQAAAMPYALMGLHDQRVEGMFEWADGTPLGYTNWGDGEPNDSNENEDCGAIQGSSGYVWNDVPCDLLTNSAVLCSNRP